MKPTISPEHTGNSAYAPTVTIRAEVMTDLVNSLLNLRACAQNHPRMDAILHATLDYAADSIEALVQAVDAQELAVAAS